MKLVILDNGHGRETHGKRSPVWADGAQLFEWELNRDVVGRIATELETLGLPYRILVPETFDVPLAERCRRANRLFSLSSGEAFLVSVHANAGGGTGWECYTTPGKTRSDELATLFCKAAQTEFPEMRMRFDYSDGDPDKESPFYILKHTQCPAILTENFFMDTEIDCRLLLDHAGRQRIAKLHVEAIKQVFAF